MPILTPEGETDKHFSLYELDYVLLELCKWEKTDIILDVACGNGYYSDAIRSKVQKIYGTDLNIDLLYKAKKDFSMEVVTGNAQLLPFQSSIFTKVYCYRSFYQFPDLTHAAKEMIRVCKPEGTIVITYSNIRHPYYAVNQLLDKMISLLFGRRLLYADRRNSLSMSKLIRMFSDMGAKLETCYSCNISFFLIHRILIFNIISNAHMLKITRAARAFLKRPLCGIKPDPLAFDYVIVFKVCK